LQPTNLEAPKAEFVCTGMPGRLPSENDGIPGTSSIVPPPKGQPATNVLILLHGLGDTQISFKTFGEKLQLPETVCISVRGTARMPFDLDGAHWGDDIVFNDEGTIDADTGFKKSTTIVLDDFIRKVLVEKCGYQFREIFLFGFGQGGMLALNVATELGRDEELGGVVSVGGALPAGASIPDIGGKNKTPVLICHGYRQSSLNDEHIDKLKDTFSFVENKEWRKSGDAMPASRDEMLPIMQFWARRLRSVRGVPKGSVEMS
jgi:predicted esterase